MFACGHALDDGGALGKEAGHTALGPGVAAFGRLGRQLIEGRGWRRGGAGEGAAGAGDDRSGIAERVVADVVQVGKEGGGGARAKGRDAAVAVAANRGWAKTRFCRATGSRGRNWG